MLKRTMPLQIKPNDAFGKQMISNLEVLPESYHFNVGSSCHDRC